MKNGNEESQSKELGESRSYLVRMTSGAWRPWRWKQAERKADSCDLYGIYMDLYRIYMVINGIIWDLHEIYRVKFIWVMQKSMESMVSLELEGGSSQNCHISFMTVF